MKAKIGVVGHFGFGKSFYDGQTVKTKILYEELKNNLGYDQVLYLDTNNYIKKIIKVLISSLILSFKCESIVINTSKKGRSIFIPLFYILKQITHSKVYCMVIGGGFPEQMKNNIFIDKIAKRLDGIFVETNTMLEKLNKLGYNNVLQLNNFKKLNILQEDELHYNYSEPFKICTFSRVSKEKGIEEAINAVIKINKQQKKHVFSLDIYGQIESKYENDFFEIIKKSPDYINYGGIVEYENSVQTIRNYFLLIFPTLYKTEGVPGTIIDAYASGVPVIASNWNSCDDVVDNDLTGIIFNMGETDDLISKLKEAYMDSKKIFRMKANCLNKALEYSSDVVIKEFIELINDKTAKFD